MQASSLNQEIVNDTAKLMMHRLIARLLVRDPLLLDRARVSLDQMSVLFQIDPLSRSGKSCFASHRGSFACS